MNELLDRLNRGGFRLSMSEPRRAHFETHRDVYGRVIPELRSRVLRQQYSEGQAIVERMTSARAELVADWNRLVKHAHEMVRTDERFAQAASHLLEAAAPLVDRPPRSSDR